MAQMDVIEAESMSAEPIEIVRKKGLSFPVRALSNLLLTFVLALTLEFHSDC
jgi:hypothetical protein